MEMTYIFAHIPKTAGTSLRYHFQKHLKDQVEFIHLANKGNKVAQQQGRLPFSHRSEQERDQAKVILGHNVNKDTAALVPFKKPFTIIFFRNPVDWEISRYNQYANAKHFRGETFLDYRAWRKIEKVHSQFDWFLNNYCLESPLADSNDKLNQVIAYLNKFDFVGFVDNIDSDMKPIFQSLSIPETMKPENVTGKYNKKNWFRKLSNEQEVRADNIGENDFFLKIKKKFDRKC
jgi:hypothetical protein